MAQVPQVCSPNLMLPLQGQHVTKCKPRSTHAVISALHPDVPEVKPIPLAGEANPSTEPAPEQRSASFSPSCREQDLTQCCCRLGGRKERASRAASIQAASSLGCRAAQGVTQCFSAIPKGKISCLPHINNPGWAS